MKNNILNISDKPNKLNYFLKKDSIMLIVLENKVKLNIMNVSNLRVEVSDKNISFTDLMNNLNEAEDFYIFGDEEKTLYAIRKNFIVSCVNYNNDLFIVDKNSNKYFVKNNPTKNELDKILSSI